MVDRDPEEIAHERAALDAAHSQNEAGRDAFVALAHTALFAASIAFVGDVRPINEAIWKPVLIAGWGASVTGLLALAISFGAARKAIDAQRAALYEAAVPPNRWASRLNTISLWSFPVAILCLFAFVTANVTAVDERPKTRNAAAGADAGAHAGPEGHCTPTESAEPGATAGNRSRAGPASAITANLTAPSANACSQVNCADHE